MLKKLKDILYKREKLLEMIAIFLLLCSVSIRFNNRDVKLIWSDYPFVAIAMILVCILIAVVWVQIQKQKLQTLFNEIKNKSSESSVPFNEKLEELSSRQREVFNLIVQGKSNKEIMTALNIELSTLKSHINQIYKTLEIKSRKEARSLQTLLEK